MPYGYQGKILHVDLTTSKLAIEQPEEAFYRKYMGGSALGMQLIDRGSDRRSEPHDRHGQIPPHGCSR